MTLRRWLDALPDETFERRPVLAVLHAASLLSTGDVSGVEARLRVGERWIAAAHDERARHDAEAAGMVVRFTDFLARLPSAIPLYRAALARMRGDTAEAIAQAEAALVAAGTDQPLQRGGAAGMLALAHWTAGDLDASYAAWVHSFEGLETAGHIADLLGVSIAMADIRRTQGRLGDARRIFERGLAIGMGTDATPLRGTADMHVGLSEIDRERNDLGAAEEHLAAAASLGDGLGLPQNPYRLRVALARVALAKGDPPEAVRQLDEAADRYDGDFFPDVRPIAAMRARILVSQGELAEARAWARDAGIAADDEPSYLREFDQATLARLLHDGERADAFDEAAEFAIDHRFYLAAFNHLTPFSRHASVCAAQARGPAPLRAVVARRALRLQRHSVSAEDHGSRRHPARLPARPPAFLHLAKHRAARFRSSESGGRLHVSKFFRDQRHASRRGRQARPLSVGRPGLERTVAEVA